MAFSNENLDVSLYFDLDNNRFRIQDNSPYTSASPAIAEADIRGVYSLTDPNSNVLHENADYDNPDVATSIDADLYSAYESFTVANGVYTLVYNVKDVDTSTVYTKTFTFTYAATVIPTVSIGIDSNVGLATIESNDNTSYGATVTLNSRSHVLTYPGSWGSSSTTGAQIALTELYTGQYSTTITSDITITGTDNLIIDIDITGTQTHDVWDSDGMYALREPLATFYDRWVAAQTENPKEGRRLEYLWTEINANYTLYNSAKQNGDLDTASTYLNNIKTILSAEDIDTTVDPSESVPVVSSLPGYATQWLSGSGAPADTLGRNGDFYIDNTSGTYYKKIDGSYVEQGSLSAYAFTVTPGTVIVPTDYLGNNQDYTNAISEISVYSSSENVTDDFTFTKSTLSNADGSVTDNVLTVSSITADTGYIDVIASKVGVDSFTARIYIKKAKEGSAIPDISTVDDVTIGINASKLYVKNEGIDTTQLATGAVTGVKLDSGIVDNSTLELNANTLQVKDLGIGTSQIANDAVDGSKLANDITIANNLTVTGDLTVNGTTTTLDTETLQVEDKNIEMGNVPTPSDATANGGGITLKGATDKTLIWDSANNNWTLNQNVNIPTGKVFKINNVSMLSNTTLGSTVVNSSLTSVGTLTSLGVTGAITGSSTLSLTSTATASNFILSSDERLKDDINVVNTQNIQGVDIVCFHYKNDKTKRLRYGVIAQSLQETHPEMVYEDENGFLQVAYIDFLLVRLLENENKVAALENRIRRLEKLIK